MHTYPILQDPELNTRLAQDGHVILPLLDAAAVQALTTAYFAAHPQSPDRFYASSHAKDTDFRIQMSDTIQHILQAPLAKWLDQGELLGCAYIAKPPGKTGFLRPHADWNLTDETRARSYNLWIALVDMEPENGAVHILPGSHLWFDHYRGPGIPNPLDPVMEAVWPHMRPLYMRAGEALLYDHRLYHASPVNQTPGLRLACVGGVILRDEPMRHYRMEDGKIMSYASNTDFFMKGDPEVSPGKQLCLGPVPYDFPQVDLPRLHTLLGIPQPASAAPPTRSWWQRLLGR